MHSSSGVLLHPTMIPPTPLTRSPFVVLHHAQETSRAALQSPILRRRMAVPFAR